MTAEEYDGFGLTMFECVETPSQLAVGEYVYLSSLSILDLALSLSHFHKIRLLCRFLRTLYKRIANDVAHPGLKKQCEYV